jgi:cation diffusion facilitator family transporter
MEARAEREGEALARKWAALSVVSNSTLVAAKLIVGFLSGSIAVVAEAAHSGIDLVAALIAFVAVRLSARAPDAEHPYGHGKFENIAAAMEAVLIVWVAWEIVVSSVAKLAEGTHPEVFGAAFAVMVASAVVNWWVSKKLFAVARKSGSQALEGDAWHLRTDVWSSAAVAVGVAGAWITGWQWFDPAFAIVVAVIIGWAGVALVRSTARDLVDRSLPPAKVERLSSLILGFSGEFIGMHALRTRQAGRRVYVDFHLTARGETPLGDVHCLCDRLEAAIEKEIGPADVTIHVEPAGAPSAPVCVADRPHP